MDRPELLDPYEWRPGVCFRHPSKGEVATARVETIRPPAGGIQDVRACEECVLEMQRQRAAASERRMPRAPQEDE